MIEYEKSYPRFPPTTALTMALYSVIALVAWATLSAHFTNIPIAIDTALNAELSFGLRLEKVARVLWELLIVGALIAYVGPKLIEKLRQSDVRHIKMKATAHTLVIERLGLPTVSVERSACVAIADYGRTLVLENGRRVTIVDRALDEKDLRAFRMELFDLWWPSISTTEVVRHLKDTRPPLWMRELPVACFVLGLFASFLFGGKALGGAPYLAFLGSIAFTSGAFLFVLWSLRRIRSTWRFVLPTSVVASDDRDDVEAEYDCA